MFIPPGVRNRIREGTIPVLECCGKSVDVTTSPAGHDEKEAVVMAGKSQMYVLYVEKLARAIADPEFRAPFAATKGGHVIEAIETALMCKSAREVHIRGNRANRRVRVHIEVSCIYSF